MAFFASTLAHRDTIVMTAYAGGLQEFAASVSTRIETNNVDIPEMFHIRSLARGVEVPWHIISPLCLL